MRETLARQDYAAIDFMTIPSAFREVFTTKASFLETTLALRDQIESDICRLGAQELIALLPKTPAERTARFKRLQTAARTLDWDHVVVRLIDNLS